MLDTLLDQCASLDCDAPVTLRTSGEATDEKPMPYGKTMPDGKTMPRRHAYERAAKIALDWQQEFPEANGRWTACCEDVAIDNTLTNDNSVQPLQAAQYLIAKRVPGWEERARRILATVERQLVFNMNCKTRSWTEPAIS